MFTLCSTWFGYVFVGQLGFGWEGADPWARSLSQDGGEPKPSTHSDCHYLQSSPGSLTHLTTSGDLLIMVEGRLRKPRAPRASLR